MIKKSLFMAIVLAGLAWQASGVQAAATDLVEAIRPETVTIDAAFNGTQVSVTGNVAADADVMIRVVGKTEEYKLKQKGRALGVLWMNMGSVHIAKVPNLFLLYGPDGAGSAQTEFPPQLGMESIRQGAEIVAQDPDKKGLLEEFFKLKQKAGLYGTMNKAIQYGAANGATKPFTASLKLPSALPQGAFDIDVFAIRNGAVMTQTVRHIEVKEVGLPAWISELAFQHGAIYGTLSVLIAIFAGWFTGILFKSSKGGAH